MLHIRFLVYIFLNSSIILNECSHFYAFWNPVIPIKVRQAQTNFCMFAQRRKVWHTHKSLGSVKDDGTKMF